MLGWNSLLGWNTLDLDTNLVVIAVADKFIYLNLFGIPHFLVDGIEALDSMRLRSRWRAYWRDPRRANFGADPCDRIWNHHRARGRPRHR